LALSLATVTKDVKVIAFSSGREGQAPGLYEQLVQGRVDVMEVPALRWPAGLAGLLIPRPRKSWQSELDGLITFGPFQLLQLGHLVRRGGTRVVLVEAMGHDGARVKAIVGARVLNRFATAVVTLCHLERLRMVALGVDAGKLHVVFNPIDTAWIEETARRILSGGRGTFLQRLGLDPSRRLIVCAASLLPRKRQDIAIRAFARLAAACPEWLLVLAGSGPEETRLRALARDLGVHERVVFLGQLVIADVVGLISCADVIVHCSNAETFGYSMIEPLLLRKPTLVTRVGIGWELERADLAEVVPPDDEDAFRLGLMRILQGGSRVYERLARARAFVLQNCQVNRVARDLAVLAGVSTFSANESPG